MQTTAIPFPSQFEDLEQLVQRLYLPGPPQAITAIQDQLQKWQRSEAGWEVAERLLQSADPNVRFFGALTLTVKLNLDWQKLDTENGPSSEAVLSGLITTIINAVNRNEEHFVLRKLCTSLVTYFCRPISVWSFPARQIICALHEGQYVHEDVLHNIALTDEIIQRLKPLQTLTVLCFITDLVQEIMKLDLPEQYHERMPKNAADIQRLLRSTLEYGSFEKSNGAQISHTVQSLSDVDVKIRQAALSCFSSCMELCENEWMPSTEEFAIIANIIPHAIMNIHAGVEDATAIFIDLLIDCRTLFDSKAARHAKDLLYDLILSGWSRSQLSELEDADPSAIMFGRFIIAFAELELSSLLSDSVSERSKSLLTLIHHLSSRSSGEQYENNIVVYALEFWSTYVESVVDDLIECGAELPSWIDAARNEVNQAVQELMAKIVLPSSEITSSWDSDDKRSFQALRQDFGDMLESSYIILGESLTQAIANSVQQYLASQAWKPLEASLFCLNKLSDTVCDKTEGQDTSEEVLLYALFRSSLFTELSSDPNVPRRLLKTSVDMLACYSSLFRKHITLLPSALNFLFSSLQVPHLANDSARSIFTLCHSCRESLVSELPAFVQQYDAFRATPTADVYTKEKVIGGISAIVQAVPSLEDRISYIISLLSFIEQDVRQMVELVANREIESGLVMAQAAMECLANMGKALQSPDDALTGNAEQHDESSAASWLAIHQRIIRCIDMTTQVLAEDSDLLEQACNVLRAGYKEKQYGAFVLPPSATVNFVTKTNLRTPRLPVILSTAQTFVKHHIDRMKPEFARDACMLLHHVLSMLKDLGDPSQDPEVSQSLIELLGAYAQNHMSILKNELGPDLEYAFRFTIASLSGPDILPKRASTSFWANILSVCISGKPDDQILAREILQYFVTEFCDALIFQISGDAPQTALPYISVPFSKLLVVQRNVKQMIDQSLSKRFGTDPIEGARIRFVQSIMSAKGITARKVISDFWQSCRRHAMTNPSRPDDSAQLAGSAVNPQLID